MTPAPVPMRFAWRLLARMYVCVPWPTADNLELVQVGIFLVAKLAHMYRPVVY